MKKILLTMMMGLSIFTVGAITNNKEIKVDFKTDYDNVAIMESNCKEEGDYIIEFINFNGFKTTVECNKINGERIKIPTDCIEVKVREK